VYGIITAAAETMNKDLEIISELFIVRRKRIILHKTSSRIGIVAGYSDKLFSISPFISATSER
jgi:hypothetical protein